MTVLMSLAAASSAYAQQNLRSGYFLDGYTYGYKFNPAFQGERGFIALPALGRTSVGVESSLAMSDVIYPPAIFRPRVSLTWKASSVLWMKWTRRILRLTLWPALFL